MTLDLTGKTLDRAQAIIYEAITGKCWHVVNPKHILRDPHHCPKCSSTTKVSYGRRRSGDMLDNPDLMTLDAWRIHIWPVMSDEQWLKYSGNLIPIIIGKHRFAEPIHHIEAALRAIPAMCPDCQGSGEIYRGFKQEGLAETYFDPCTTCQSGYNAWQALGREVEG